MSHETLIIGSGMAGLACARALGQAGHNPLILDKGRGIGGRMAARRVTIDGDEIGFDHGAQYLSPRSSGFAHFLTMLSEATADWPDDAQKPRHVGLPGMSGLPRAMAEGLSLRQATEVTALRRDGRAWVVTTQGGTSVANRLVLTIPAPQAATLLREDHPLAAPFASVEMVPCLTLMAAFPATFPAPFSSRAPETGPLAWIAQDSRKPGRAGRLPTWVAQARTDWSTAHLEDTPDDITARLLPLLCDAIGAQPAEAIFTGAHRWRHAQTATPLERPFLRSNDASLYLGGDWCLGPHAENAWTSGSAIARDILENGNA